MIPILQTAMKTAVQSRRLFSRCRVETLSDPATIVTNGDGVQFMVCVGMDVLIDRSQQETISALYEENGEVWAQMESGPIVPASKIFQPHHTWIEL